MQNSKLSRLALLRFPALQEVCCFHFVFSLAKGNANVASYWSLQLFGFFFLRNYIKNYSKVRLWLVFGTVALVPLLTALRLV